jgi:nucleoside phosphorylase
MKFRRLMHERYELSCKVLLRMLAQEEDDSRKLLLLDDFLGKSQNLPSELRRYCTFEALKPFVSEAVKKRLQYKKPNLAAPRERVDVAFVTIKQPELIATKIAMKINPTEEEKKNVNGLRFWETSIQCVGAEQELKATLTMVGEAGNVSCAAACARLFNAYDVGLCILVGIGAGLKGKVAIGDCVAAELVLDYEYSRLEPSGPKKRPRPFPLDIRISRDLQYYSPVRRGWRERFAECFETLARDPYEKVPAEANGWLPNYQTGVVLAGEKLIADGRLPEMQEEYHERTRAAEMESVGFARLCQEYDVPWLVFRGISDYGDPDKHKLWQTTSALSAATAAMVFVEKEYRKQEPLF